MKRLLRRLPRPLKRFFIPEGDYCYRFIVAGDPRIDLWHVEVCPFWERLPQQFPEDAGVAVDCEGVAYCHYLKQSDLDLWYHPVLVYANGREVPEAEQHEEEDITWYGLLWDQCKECGVKERE